MRFDFNEANILKQNLFMAKQSQEDLLGLLRAMAPKTEDYILNDSISSLMKKIASLSSEEFARLREDVLNKRLVATMNSTALRGVSAPIS